MVPQFGIAKLVNITSITWAYGRCTYTFHGAYTPTFTSLGGHHLVDPILNQDFGCFAFTSFTN